MEPTTKTTTLDLAQISKLHLACGDPGRYGMDCVQITNGTARATNGRILVAIPITAEEGVEIPTVMVRGSHLAEIARGKKNEKRTLDVLESGEVSGYRAKRGDLEMAGIVADEFPDIELILSQLSFEGTLTLNVAYLAQAAKALGAEEVTLRIPTLEGKGGVFGAQVTGPVEIVAHDIPGRAVIMPITRS